MKKYVIVLLILFGLVLVGCNEGNEDEPKQQEDLEDFSNDDETNRQEDEAVDDKEDDDTSGDSNLEEDNNEQQDEQQEDQSLSFNENDAIELINNFQERLFVESDDDYKVTSFNSEDELVQYISEYADPNLVRDFVEQFYYEDEDGLYIIPQSSPPMLDINKPMTLEKQNETRYLAIQEEQSEAYGDVKFNILIEYVEGKFIITNYGIN
ncbi:hypothetical protein ACLIA0_14675 [Bacillaceae bacterium W0354]